MSNELAQQQEQEQASEAKTPEKLESKHTSERPESKGFLDGVVDVVVLFFPHQRFPGAILLGILGAYVVTVWKIPTEKVQETWLWTIVPIFLFVVFYLVATSVAAKQIRALSRKQRRLKEDNLDLENKITMLCGEHENLVEKNKVELGRIELEIASAKQSINEDLPEDALKNLLIISELIGSHNLTDPSDRIRMKEGQELIKGGKTISSNLSPEERSVKLRQ
jgi:hypothetical protein